MKLNPYLKLCGTRVACALLWLGLVKMQESIFTGPWASDRPSKEQRTCVCCVWMLPVALNLPASSPVPCFSMDILLR